jgi:hypothetical protein
MRTYAIVGFILVLFIISAFVYVFVFAENRNYPNNTARENIDFVTSTFDNNMPTMSKIQDFDIFKYSGFDIKNPLYTYTNKSASNPYNKVATVSDNPTESLNSTLLPDDIAVEMVEAALPVSGSVMEDTTPSLTGLNASTEASIRESMVKSELRRVRR